MLMNAQFVILFVGFSCFWVSFGQVQDLYKSTKSILTPSSFSASSFNKNQEDSKPNHASLYVFNANDDTIKAWCPGKPVKDELQEWLQVEFDSLKIVKILLTRGRGPNTKEFVPYFYMQYQRQDGPWYNYVSHSGERLLKANEESNDIKTINLVPPMIVRRFRIFPFQTSVHRSMCLKLAALGNDFPDSVVEYEIPEGDVYRSSVNVKAALNDSSFDGMRSEYPLSTMTSSLSTTTKNNVAKTDFSIHRPYLHGGLGVLIDKSIFFGNISIVLQPPFSLRKQPTLETQAYNVVGWFRRSGLPSTSSLSKPYNLHNISMIFKFDSVRQFSSVSLHALNSHQEHVSVFRQAYIQFSVGGRLYDRNKSPIVFNHPRDDSVMWPRWISIPLESRVGAFVRITLTFDYDWIVLSEVLFNSEAVTDVIEVEKIGSTQLITPTNPVNQFTNSADSGTIISNESIPIQFNNANTKKNARASSSEASKSMEPLEISFLMAVAFCCIGSFAFFFFLVFVIWRVRQIRRVRVKKKQLLAPLGSSPSSHQLQPSLQQCVINQNGVVSSFGVQNLNNMPMNAVGMATTGTTYCLANNTATSTLPPSSTDHKIDLYAKFNSGLSPDGLLALRLMQQQHQQSQNCDSSLAFNSSMSSMMLSPNGRYIDPCVSALQQRLEVELPRQHQHIVSTIASTTGISPSSFTSGCGALGGIIGNPLITHSNFYPPPPDQPLPPLPPTTPISVNEATNLITSGARNSTINPYAAASLNGYIIDDSGMVISTHTDGSLAEYASASLVNGQAGLLPIRPPSLHGISQNFGYPGPQSSLNSPESQMILMANSTKFNQFWSEAKSVGNGVGAGGMINGVPSVGFPSYHSVVLPSGQTGYFTAFSSPNSEAIGFSASQYPQNQWHLPNYPLGNELSANFYQTNGCGPAFISSDTLKSIDTIPRDFSGLHHINSGLSNNGSLLHPVNGNEILENSSAKK